jgi:hypothetical protein
MDIAEAERLLEQLDFRYLWVTLINREVPEWQVYEQSPDPGTLIDLGADRIRLCVAVYVFTPTAPSQGGGNCGSVTAVGTCLANVAYWCEGTTLRIHDCENACDYGDGICMAPHPFMTHAECYCI